ncbi:DUF2080 family transposase-associated protein [Candidatus Pacearchaeota archaeon]|nr:DUF2080 family transposase-associated protein [Candidatus Pacearchaeota archaeon]
MKKVKFNEKTELKVKNIRGFMKRKVVISGTSAKVTCPKEFLGGEAILIILENGAGKRDSSSKRRKSNPKKRK